ncbi:MAG: class I SAM-dependent methyltransferase [Phycisphaerales bacterium]
MLGELLSDPRERRTALLVLVAMLTTAIVLISFGVAFPSLSVLLVLGLVVICSSVALVTKLLITAHVHLRGTAGRLADLNDRYDATEQWLERFDQDARRSFEVASQLHGELKARVEQLETSVATLKAIRVRLDELDDGMKGVRGSLKEQAERSATKEELRAIEDARASLAEELGSVSKRLEVDLAGFRQELTTLEAEARRLTVALDEASAESKASNDKTREEFASSVEGLEAKLADEIQSARAQSEEAARELRASIDAASTELDRKREDSTKAATQKVESALDAATRSLTAKADESASRIRTASSLLGRLRGDGYVQFSRVLSNDAEKQLGEVGLAVVPAELRYLERKLHVVEGLCEGRLAGSTDDAVARALMSRLVKSDELRILEIGVLFGVGAIFMHHALTPFFKSVHLTLLDPFDGYYGSDHLDPLTGQPVTLGGVRRNLERCGVPAEDAEIVAKFSTDDEALARVTELGPFGVVIIDGDHSHEGIRRDFERYADLVQVGGVLIIDDYGSADWPDVTTYTDEVVEKDRRFERVALVGKTIAYRRKAVRSAGKAQGARKSGRTSARPVTSTSDSDTKPESSTNHAPEPSKRTAAPTRSTGKATKKRSSRAASPKTERSSAADGSSSAEKPAAEVESKPPASKKKAKAGARRSTAEKT